MKILMVAIPNYHFFQWVNQLKDSGYEVYWFDVTDGGSKSPKIKWVTQIKGWKLKWDYPFRTRIKKQFPKSYLFIQKFNERAVSQVFEKAINNIEPDIVHCFEMQLSGLPILPVMEQNKLPFIYSSWGSDVFYYKELGVSKEKLSQFYRRVDYLITDCKRDHEIMMKNGFSNQFLGVFSGNGGLTIDHSKIKPSTERDTILIKGYDDGVGKASLVLEALERISKDELQNKNIVIYSADDTVQQQIKASKKLSRLSITVYSRFTFIENIKLLELMGQSCIHITKLVLNFIDKILTYGMGIIIQPYKNISFCFFIKYISRWRRTQRLIGNSPVYPIKPRNNSFRFFTIINKNQNFIHRRVDQSL